MLHVHHHTYARLGHERDDDLAVLCPRCDTPHARKRGGFLRFASHLPRAQGTTHAPLIAEATAGLRYVSRTARTLPVLPI